jgi:hypothetical protein
MLTKCRLTFVLVALTLLASSVSADDRHRVFLTQQDTVKVFNLDINNGRGDGFQVGTATGLISGTTFVDFHFFATGAPAGDVLPIGFSNKVIITDIDGDQIFFDNEGTGSFHLGFPGVEFQGSGGPLRGTYVVTGATGKFKVWKVGSRYNYRAIATNPPLPGALGTVFVEVSSRSGRD